MRPTFGRAYIEEAFQRIADGLADSVTVYLIGGGAMALRDLNGATKDIDLVVADGDAYGQLWGVLMNLGVGFSSTSVPRRACAGTHRRRKNKPSPSRAL